MNLNFDADRSTRQVEDLQGRTHIVAQFGQLPLRIDETGETVQAPLRMTVSDRLGVALEIGPYSVSTEDAAALRQLLDLYLTRARWAAGGYIPMED